MEKTYYKQGFHLVRVYWNDELFEKVERYDIENRKFISDYNMIIRIENNDEVERLNIRQFWHYIALYRRFSLN